MEEPRWRARTANEDEGIPRQKSREVNISETLWLEVNITQEGWVTKCKRFFRQRRQGGRGGVCRIWECGLRLVMCNGEEGVGGGTAKGEAIPRPVQRL